MDFAGGIGEITETSEMKRTGEQTFSKDALDKYDKMFDDDKLENMELGDSDNVSGETSEIEEKFNRLFETDDAERLLFDSEILEASECRQLTENEKIEVGDATGWSDEKIEQKCTIDSEGVIHFKCREEKGNQSGIEYITKTIDLNGIKVEIVVPKFESKFDTQLPVDAYKSSNTRQFNECNKQLYAAVENSPMLKKEFTKEQLEDIKNGDTPRGYTWHHNEEPGKMQLVKTAEHDQCIGGAPHTGGNSLWGNKAEDKKKEGVSF